MPLRRESFMPDRPTPVTLTPAVVVSSHAVFAAKTVASEEVDVAFGMPIGKLRHRAGIVSLAHAAGETEVKLGSRAAEEALRSASLEASGVDWILATTETHHAFPALAAQIHREIGAREGCGAMDIGGACLGFVHALAVAKAFVESGQAGTVLVVTADVHSRTLTPRRVAGEFGGLFGDGASAFVVRGEAVRAERRSFLLRDFFFGCASQYQQAIQVSAEPNDRLRVVFDGDALSRAATARLDECIRELERRSGVQRGDVAAFATHQPNPRLVALLAKRAGVAFEKFPLVADTRGNLGSTTCAAALHYALERAPNKPTGAPQPIFLASLGPGLLFGGGWLEPVIPSGDPR
jgi:3-oxoacyl-[acyl-carrier-protein] synthase-3